MSNCSEIKKIQRLQLKIAKEFKRICEAHKIAYSLSGGSLLGAVRHSGFIPWDDDFDVEMLRKDYKRFLDVAPLELGEEYFLQTWRTDKHYAFPYAKLMLKKTIYAERLTEHANIEKGIFIDIFVADSVSDKRWIRNLQCIACDKLRVLLCEKNYYLTDTGRKGFKKIAYNYLSHLVPLKCWQMLFTFFMTCCNNTNAKEISVFGSCYGSQKGIRLKEFYYDLKEYPFEDTYFTGIADFDAYLKALYGDYMEFPPEEERYNRHGIIKIDFGDFYDLSTVIQDKVQNEVESKFREKQYTIERKTWLT